MQFYAFSLPETGFEERSDGIASIHVDTFANDLRRHKNQQFVLVIDFLGGLEEISQYRDITEPRYFGGYVTRRGLENAAEHNGLTVVHQHLCRDFARVDGRNIHAAGGHDDRTDVIVTDIEIENDAAVRRNVRRDFQRQHRLLEAD